MAGGGRDEGSGPGLSGVWGVDQVRAHLDAAHYPVRLSFLDASGHPRVVSLWFERRGDHLWCATQRTAVVATAIGNDGRVGFEVAADSMPYRGVRGWGHASVHDEAGPEVLRSLLSRYLTPTDSLAARLLARAATEVAIEIVPERWFSWDFADRMPVAPESDEVGH